LLDTITAWRLAAPWLLFLLPAGGVIIYALYQYFGKESLKGNNLVIEEIHTPGGGVPASMAPLVFVSTLITHLFGGSAGREGTAVQMAGSLSAFLARKLDLSRDEMQILLIAGIGSGFAAVFGTPLTGAVFAFEVLRRARFRFEALLPVAIAAFLANKTCALLGIHHTLYSVLPGIHYAEHAWLVATAAMLFGLAARAFVLTEHLIKKLVNLIATPWLRPVLGGIVIILLTFLLGTRDYLGIGVNTPGGVSIVSAFSAGGAGTFSWFWKLLFTAITLGSGFKGGEVTPLFFIGATLGNAFASFTHAPVDLFAALGFIAVFAGATNTPIACTIMGIELFGAEYAGYFALACLIAYLFSGKKGIYAAQNERRFKFF
jgi:H+/Cl- antiporter ClcA